MSGRAPLLQRKCACGGTCAACGGSKPKVRRLAAGTPSGHAQSVDAAPAVAGPLVAQALASPGRPLDEPTRALMSSRFGHDFQRVRIHEGPRATAAARSVAAAAFTIGREVVLGESVAPASPSGLHLLAHELAHVVQQGDVPATSGSIEVGDARDAAEREADAAAHAVVAGRPAPRLGAHPLAVARAGTDESAAAPPAAPTAAPPAAPAPATATLTLVRAGGGATFISTDAITINATLSGAPTPAPAIEWTAVETGPKTGDTQKSPQPGPSFTFTPKPTGREATGSRDPNDPITYRVEAQAGATKATLELAQDESDIIRQEYLDLGPTTPPARDKFVASSDPNYNVGNYGLIVDDGMANAFTNTRTKFAELTQAAAAPAPQANPAPSTPAPQANPAPTAAASAPAGAPASAPTVTVPEVTVSSGYRNPRRNVAAGSQYPTTSKHVLGRALDLKVAGANATLWTRLRQAGQDAGNPTSICEQGPTQKPCNDAAVDHVHIQW